MGASGALGLLMNTYRPPMRAAVASGLRPLVFENNQGVGCWASFFSDSTLLFLFRSASPRLWSLAFFVRSV
jgi:hypothetical protein